MSVSEPFYGVALISDGSMRVFFVEPMVVQWVFLSCVMAIGGGKFSGKGRGAPRVRDESKTFIRHHPH